MEASTSISCEDLEMAALQAELARPLVHECNNFLNTLLLQLTLLEQDVPEQLRPDLVLIRQQGRNLASLTQEWQAYRTLGKDTTAAVDLNRVIEETIHQRDLANSLGHWSFSMQLEPGPLTVRGSPLDLRRLCYFLVKNACAVLEGSGQLDSLIVQTQRTEDEIRLSVLNSGPTITPEEVAAWLDLHISPRPAGQRLLLAACQTLAQRVKAKFHLTSRPEGGVARSVVWPNVG